VLGNVNRWRQQMGLPELDAPALAELPRIRVLGGEAIVVDLEGDFRDDMRRPPVPQARMLGAIRVRAQDVVFVKMTGPAAVVAPEREAFLDFCRSLRE
jgi:hypothetical protein